jgi:hypothetical protein
MSDGALTLDSLLAAFAARVVQRSRPFAVQVEDGSYRWLHEDITPEALLDHLDGDVTLALSSSDGLGNCRWLCLDVDDPAPSTLSWLLSVRTALAELGLPGLVEASRRGGHLWLFLETPLAVTTARAAVLAALAQLEAQGVAMLDYELYPDVSAQHPGPLGHAVRLLLGVHQLTGKRYPLFDHDGTPCAFTSTEAALRFVVGWPVVDATAIRELAARWKGRVDRPHAPFGRTHRPQRKTPATANRAAEVERVGTRSSVIRWVDAQVSPLDLLEQLGEQPEMKRVGAGHLGWCPFHDDRASDEHGRPGTPSFYVVRDRRYGWSWRCLSTNCREHSGPMRHSFRLFQLLTGLTAKAAVREAIAWWPASGRARPLSPSEVPSTFGANQASDQATHNEQRSVRHVPEHSPRG